MGENRGALILYIELVWKKTHKRMRVLFWCILELLLGKEWQSCSNIGRKVQAFAVYKILPGRGRHLCCHVSTLTGIALNWIGLPGHVGRCGWIPAASWIFGQC